MKKLQPLKNPSVYLICSLKYENSLMLHPSIVFHPISIISFYCVSVVVKDIFKKHLIEMHQVERSKYIFTPMTSAF